MKSNLLKQLTLCGFLLFGYFIFPNKVFATTYYVDQTGGNDGNLGTSTGHAWKTISKVNGSVFSAGDNILFKKGETWRESLAEPYPGSSGNPITISSYGDATNKPIISGADVLSTSGWNLYTGDTYVSDTFDRANQLGWGTADGGSDSLNAWDGGTTDFAISGNTGVFVGAWVFNKKNNIGDSQARDAEITVGFSSIPNLDRQIGLRIRQMSDNAYYSVTYQRDIATFKIDKNTEINPWVYNLGSTTVGNLSAASMRVRIETSNGAVRIRAKIWSGSEPVDWTLDVTEAANTTLGGTWWDPSTSTAHTGPFLSGNLAVVGGNGGSGQLAVDNFSAKSLTTAVNTYFKTLTTDPGNYILEDGNKMTKVTSLSTVDATEGSFYWASNVLYLHPTDNGDPSSNGKTYEVPTRNILINIDSSRYITIDGIQFEMNQGSLMLDANNSDNLIVKNCNFKYSNGYHVWVGDSDKSDNQTFQNNLFTYSFGTGIAIHGDNVSVTGNTFTYSGRAIELRDITDSHSSNFTIESNNIENMGSSTETNAGILLDGDTNGTNTDAHTGGQIRYNLFKTIQGRVIDGFYLNTTIAYNIISEVTDGITNSGMAIEINGGGNTVYNNTFYNIQNTSIQVGSDPVVANTGNTIKNNIIYSSGNWIVLITNTVAASQIFDNNNYWPESAGTSKYYWKGAGYNFTNWKLQSGGDTNSNETDPLLVNPPTNFQLQNTSPVINIGANVGLTSDYNGNPIVGLPDIGAYEFQPPSSTPTNIPTSIQTSSDSSSSNNSSNICNDSKPSSVPNLFQIDLTSTSATLNFVPAKSPLTYYYISFGTNQNNLEYGTQFNSSYYPGVQKVTINALKPNTRYYFKIRGGNGCTPGDWSNILLVRTTLNSRSLKRSYFTSVRSIPEVVFTPNATKKTTKTISKAAPLISPTPIIEIDSTKAFITPTPIKTKPILTPKTDIWTVLKNKLTNFFQGNKR